MFVPSFAVPLFDEELLPPEELEPPDEPAWSQEHVTPVDDCVLDRGINGFDGGLHGQFASTSLTVLVTS
ncbi:MAG: hypothetical protein ACXVQ7_04625 [Actinomycetota bacterium]